MAAVLYETNPYGANINPTSTSGLKLYNTATADRGDDSKLSLQVSESKKFLEAMRDDAAKFSWGKLTMKVTDADGDDRDILQDFQHVTITLVRVFTKRYLS